MARLRPTRIGFRAQINGTCGGASAGSGPSNTEAAAIRNHTAQDERHSGKTGQKQKVSLIERSSSRGSKNARTDLRLAVNPIAVAFRYRKRV
jgi:hypothetical protein